MASVFLLTPEAIAAAGLVVSVASAYIQSRRNAVNTEMSAEELRAALEREKQEFEESQERIKEENEKFLEERREKLEKQMQLIQQTREENRSKIWTANKNIAEMENQYHINIQRLDKELGDKLNDLRICEKAEKENYEEQTRKEKRELEEKHNKEKEEARRINDEKKKELEEKLKQAEEEMKRINDERDAYQNEKNNKLLEMKKCNHDQMLKIVRENQKIGEDNKMEQINYIEQYYNRESELISQQNRNLALNYADQNNINLLQQFKSEFTNNLVNLKNSVEGIYLTCIAIKDVLDIEQTNRNDLANSLDEIRRNIHACNVGVDAMKTYLINSDGCDKKLTDKVKEIMENTRNLYGLSLSKCRAQLKDTAEKGIPIKIETTDYLEDLYEKLDNKCEECYLNAEHKLHNQLNQDLNNQLKNSQNELQQ